MLQSLTSPDNSQQALNADILGRKIMVVDDDPTTLRYTSRMLLKNGLDVVTANNGNEAISMVASERPDAILLDIMMPQMDGFRTLEILRGMSQTEQTPVIILTSENNVHTFIKVINNGADDFLAKPFHHADLLRKLRLVLTADASTRAATHHGGTANRPLPGEYPPFYQPYVDLVGNKRVFDLLAAQEDEYGQFIARISDQRGTYRYADDKWTLKEVIAHVIDVERILAYRSLAISRRESQPLPGFDQQRFSVNSGANRRLAADLAREFRTLRLSNVEMFRGFDDDMLMRRGVTGSHPITVRALLYVIVGHAMHHIDVIRERYLV